MTRRRTIASVIGAVIVLLVAALATADVRFLARGAYEEARILLKRHSLDKLIADPATPADRRALFQIVRDARQFAHDSLGLNAGGRYSSYSDVGRDTLVLVISASPRNALSEYVWHFPLVGAVPYKGFFDFTAAAREAQALEVRGYDTYTRPAPAFSTLGYFDDPLVSTMLTRDRVELAATVFHELTHSTVYVPSQTPFDESLANFVGWRAAECFFRSRGDTAGATRAARIWQAERREGDVFSELSVRLSALYRRHDSDAATARERDSLFAAARATLGWPARVTLNNASVIAQRIYLTRLDAFDTALQGFSLAATLADIGRATKDGEGQRDPYAAITSGFPRTKGGACNLTSN